MYIDINNKKHIKFQNYIKIGHSNRYNRYERLKEHITDKKGLFLCFERWTNIISYKRMINIDKYTIRVVTSNSVDCEKLIIKECIPANTPKKEMGYTITNSIKTTNEVFVQERSISLDDILTIIPKDKHEMVNNKFIEIIENGDNGFDFIKYVIEESGESDNYIQFEYNIIKKVLLNSEYPRIFTSIAMNLHSNYIKQLLKEMIFFNRRLDSVNSLYKEKENIIKKKEAFKILIDNIDKQEIKNTKLSKNFNNISNIIYKYRKKLPNEMINELEAEAEEAEKCI